MTEGIPTSRRHHDKTSLLSGNQEIGAIPPAPLMTHSHPLKDGCPDARETNQCRHP